MAFKLDKSKCTACGVCADICPEDVLRIEGGRAVAKYPQECWHCGSCMYDCPQQAIEITLAPQYAIRFVST
ncbi:MAG: 4Fe-4S binding protein [Gracilibacteraceae bacterium]|jgi:adenylylsulfate reductase subunit B|nr:4Fe-4S binding protein [Gracilibacteraceae bacterium]